MGLPIRVAAAAVVLGVTACGGGGHSRAPAPSLTVTVATPASDVEVSRGGTTTVAFTCDGVDAPATTRLVADADGNLASVGDQFEIAAGLPETGPTAQPIDWDTTGVPLGDYFVFAFADDGVHPTATAVAAGKVSVANVAYADQAAIKAYGVAALPDGSTIVAGLLVGTVTLGSGPTQTTLSAEGGASDADVCLARFAPGGGLVWARHAGGVNPDRCDAIGASVDGSFSIAGKFRTTATYGSGEPNETAFTTATNAAFVVAFSASGSLAWAGHVTEATPTSSAIGLRVTTAPGGYLLLGSATGSVAFDPGTAWQASLTASSTQGDAFVAKYGLDGKLAWVRRVETGSSFPGAAWVATLADGGYAVGGIVTGSTTIGPNTASPQAIASVPTTAADVYVARFDADGTIRWVWTAGGAGGEAFAGLSFFPDGSVAIAGTFRSSATFGAGDPHQTLLSTLASAGEAFLARLNSDGGF